MLSIVFFGTPHFSALVLQKLLDYQKSADKKVDYEISAVVTAPNAPLGRKQILTPSPVNQLAVANNLPVFIPQKLTPDVIATLSETKGKQSSIDNS